MFGKSDIRYILAITWLVAFLFIWFIFSSIFQMDSLEYDLDNIINGIENKDWELANKYTTEFINKYYSKKYLYQLNNSTEMFTTFENSVRQLKLSVKNKQESALEYAGLLREGLNFVVKPFSGP